MAVHQVNVTIQNGMITVDQPVVRIHEDSFVQWNGNEPFSIEFDKPNAFGARLSHAEAQRPNGPKQGNSGSYKYTIVSDKDNRIKLDPIVIVDPGTTGAH